VAVGTKRSADQIGCANIAAWSWDAMGVIGMSAEAYHADVCCFDAAGVYI